MDLNSNINNLILITMNTYQKALIEEHSQLIVRTQTLHDYVYSPASDADNKVEFANKCIQLASMKKYEECLRARMENAGIVFEDGNYFEKVASITPIIAAPSIPENNVGSDFDVDSQNKSETKENNKE